MRGRISHSRNSLRRGKSVHLLAVVPAAMLAVTLGGPAHAAESANLPDSVKRKIGFLATSFAPETGARNLGRYMQCSASIVGPNVIMTSAHCVVSDEGLAAPDNRAFFAPGWNSDEQPKYDGGNGDYWRSKEIIVNPKYFTARNSQEIVSSDIAFLIMEKKNGESLGDKYGWLGYQPDGGAVGASVEIAGYPGGSSGVPDPAKPNFCTNTIEEVSVASNGRNALARAVEFCDNMGDGASGGPWLRNYNGAWRVIGANHGWYSVNGSGRDAAATLLDDDASSLLQEALSGDSQEVSDSRGDPIVSEEPQGEPPEEVKSSSVNLRYYPCSVTHSSLRLPGSSNRLAGELTLGCSGSEYRISKNKAWRVSWTLPKGMDFVSNGEGMRCAYAAETRKVTCENAVTATGAAQKVTFGLTYNSASGNVYTVEDLTLYKIGLVRYI